MATGIEAWLLKPGSEAAAITAITNGAGRTVTNEGGYQTTRASVTHFCVPCKEIQWGKKHLSKRKVLPNGRVVNVKLRQVDHECVLSEISLGNIQSSDVQIAGLIKTGTAAPNFAWHWLRALDYALTEWNKLGNTTLYRCKYDDVTGLRTEFEDGDDTPDANEVAALLYDYNGGTPNGMRFAGSIQDYDPIEDSNNNITIDAIKILWGGT